MCPLFYADADAEVWKWIENGVGYYIIYEVNEN